MITSLDIPFSYNYSKGSSQHFKIYAKTIVDSEKPADFPYFKEESAIILILLWSHKLFYYSVSNDSYPSSA